jgi:hypothetical protein
VPHANNSVQSAIQDAAVPIGPMHHGRDGELSVARCRSSSTERPSPGEAARAYKKFFPKQPHAQSHTSFVAFMAKPLKGPALLRAAAMYPLHIS